MDQLSHLQYFQLKQLFDSGITQCKLITQMISVREELNRQQKNVLSQIEYHNGTNNRTMVAMNVSSEISARDTNTIQNAVETHKEPMSRTPTRHMSPTSRINYEKEIEQKVNDNVNRIMSKHHWIKKLQKTTSDREKMAKPYARITDAEPKLAVMDKHSQQMVVSSQTKATNFKSSGEMDITGQLYDLLYQDQSVFRKKLADFMIKHALSIAQVAVMTGIHSYYIDWFLAGIFININIGRILAMWYLKCTQNPHLMQNYLAANLQNQPRNASPPQTIVLEKGFLNLQRVPKQ